MTELDTALDKEQGYRMGMGNWRRWVLPMDIIYDSAEDWRGIVGDVEKPWLVWNVDNDWCVLQQKLVSSVGWTPVVGFDPRIGPPPLIEGAILVDFNARLKLPNLYPHFPLEFAFLFTRKLAFWHSDLLLRQEKMQKIATLFETLEDGEMAATMVSGLVASVKRVLKPRTARCWELIGCTTAGASKSQFDNGCGWWMHFYDNVNFSGDKSKGYYWDHGAGIYYWKRCFNGSVKIIPENFVSEGHFSQIGNREKYERVSPNNHMRDLRKDLSHNYGLLQCANKLGLNSFLKE